MKEHWSKAPLWIQNRIADTRVRGGILNLEGHPNRSAAMAWREAAELAMRHGYAYDAPTFAAREEIEALEKTDPIAVGAARARLSLELRQEDLNEARWSALQIWASQDSSMELAEQARAEREEQDRRARVIRRTEEILAADAESKRRKAAAAAEKEIEATSGRS